MDEEWHQQLFTEGGVPIDVYIPSKFNTRFGFVRFKTKSEGLRAIRLWNGVTIRDHKLIVKFARFTCTNNEFVPRNRTPEQQRNQYSKPGADPVKERTQGSEEDQNKQKMEEEKEKVAETEGPSMPNLEQVDNGVEVVPDTHEEKEPLRDSMSSSGTPNSMSTSKPWKKKKKEEREKSAVYRSAAAAAALSVSISSSGI
ncbi:hypothetical protein RHMOL_Rhmol13G0291300 [Rhododendron molle]|uniref:Uncharacterized protein n=1 Tax=Rhododendron molle TaxID=49168 RepID=A0ACC0LBU6_RHOML|nr:hypothetical protein RHMOL_Rhmol13G0291300 [Rhododendron molle]